MQRSRAIFLGPIQSAGVACSICTFAEQGSQLDRRGNPQDLPSATAYNGETETQARHQEPSRAPPQSCRGAQSEASTPSSRVLTVSEGSWDRRIVLPPFLFL
eukprot:scaffold529_cov308-Pinguiococcus_pyrenoidosus.AAC.7